MTSYNTDNKVGAWAKEKLKCLNDYLSAYTTILRKQDWCEGYYYLDAFAGSGKNKIRQSKDELSTQELLFEVSNYSRQDEDEENYINGSAFVALEIEHPFTEYHFIELSSERIEKLQKIKSDYESQRTIKVIHNDAASEIQKFLNSPDINWEKCRGVVLLDPFGMQVPWGIIEKIAQNGSLEVIINLPVGMAIQRLLPRSGKFSDEQRQKLTAYFGSPEWEDKIYERSKDLFGEETTSKSGDSGERLALWYRERLQKAFGFSSPPRLIKNSRGSHLYYLLFAGPNKTGAKIAEHVLNQGSSLNRMKKNRLN